MRRALLAAGLLAALAACPAAAGRLGAIDFSACELEGRGGARIHAECARFEVPENAADADSRRITLQLALLRARRARPEPDPALLLAGGPGQSALEAYSDVAAVFEPLRRDRHVLLVDQRGTGRSNPLKCPLPDFRDESQDTPAAARAQALRCLGRVSARADPRRYTTGDAIGDLEAIRAAIGAPRFNLIGGSYGTRVGLEYLRRHPQAVRTLVLDSPVPPELALLQDHAANLDEALAASFAGCRAEPACARRYRDPGAALERLRQRLRVGAIAATLPDPNTHALRRERLTPGLLAVVLRFYAYQPETAAIIPLLVAEALDGRPQPLLAQADILERKVGDSLAHGMELSVICAEDAPFLRQRPEDARSLLGTAMHGMLAAQCAVWPHGTAPADFKTPVRADAPVLILSGERDPVTPPRYGAQVRASLPRGRHLVLRGQGHTVMARGCAPRLIQRFVEAADAAALDAGCLDRLAAPPFFTGYQGSEP